VNRLGYKDKKIITDKDNRPIPQYFNQGTNQYEAIEGRYGANSFIEKGRIVKDSWSGSSTSTKTFNSSRYGFGIVNDGTADLTITINGIVFKVKPGETFEDLFEPFLSVTITGNSAYRAVARD
jgi:hypothetical protein